MLGQVITDAALGLALAGIVVLLALLHLAYVSGKIRGKKEMLYRLDETLSDLDGLKKQVLERLDAKRRAQGTDPLVVQYSMEDGEGKPVRGKASFYAFTLADWYRASVHQAIRASLEAERPDCTLMGYAAITEDGSTTEEVRP